MEEKYGKVVEMICEIYENDGESLLLVLGHLEKHEKRAGSRNLSSKWKMLYDLTGNKSAFKTYVDGMIKEIMEKNAQQILQEDEDEDDDDGEDDDAEDEESGDDGGFVVDSPEDDKD